MLLEFLAEEGGIALLDVNPGLVIWTFLIFGIVLFILSKFAWGPISNALDERAKKIHDDIDRADHLRKDAEKKLEEYLEKINGLKAEGQAIVAEARKDAEALKNDLLNQARKESEAMKNRSLREVSMARDQALEDIHKQVTEISMVIVAQILERTLKGEDHKKLIDDTVSKLKILN